MRHAFFPSGSLVAVVASGFSLLVACGGATNTSLTDPTDGGDTSDAGSSGSSGSSGTSGSSGSSGSSGTSGSSGALDAGEDGSAVESPFTGAPAYVATTGRSTLKGDHPNGGNPSKLACLSCHGPGGPGPEWFAGGSIFSDIGGTVPAAQIEVRLRDASGHAVSTYTDKLGNFLITAQAASSAGLTFPLHAGARNATATALMTEITPNGDCNNASCHGGTQGWIHLP